MESWGWSWSKRNFFSFEKNNIFLILYFQFSDFAMTTYLQKKPVEVFCKKGVPKHSPIFTGKHLCWCLFLIKLRKVALTSKPVSRQQNLWIKSSQIHVLLTEHFWNDLFGMVHMEATLKSLNKPDWIELVL